MRFIYNLPLQLIALLMISAGVYLTIDMYGPRALIPIGLLYGSCIVYFYDMMGAMRRERDKLAVQWEEHMGMRGMLSAIRSFNESRKRTMEFAGLSNTALERHIANIDRILEGDRTKVKVDG
jgi:hypothetical protein